MDYLRKIRLNEGIGIKRPHGDVKIFVREVGGVPGQRTGRIEVIVNTLIGDGSLADLTRYSALPLTDDIAVKIADTPTTGARLRLCIDKPPEYATYDIKNGG